MNKYNEVMKVLFRKTYLADLYEGRKVNDKRLKSNPMLVKQYIKTVARLEAASSLEQLYQIASLNFEALSGNYTGFYSVRINQQYRLIFSAVFTDDDPPEVSVLELEDISNHYQ